MLRHGTRTTKLLHEAIAPLIVGSVFGGLALVWLMQSALQAGASPPTLNPIQICTPWQIVSSPNPSTQHNELYDLAIINANDIWAVGYYDINNYLAQTLTMHWNGSQWSVIPSPNPDQNNYLFGVSAVSSSDVWAVGMQVPVGRPEETLTMHWDGTDWTVVPSPNPTSSSQWLLNVATVSANDVWAVGLYYPPGEASSTLMIHWDGQAWSVIPSPSPGGSNRNSTLYGISALAPNDVWAAGLYDTADGSHSLVLHWDGTQWSVSPTPDPTPDYGYGLYAIAAIATDNVWAVGVHGPPSGPTPATLTMHWDGSQWSVVPSPNFDSQVNYLFGVTGTASGDAWAVGWTNTQSLVLHWDGVQWSRQDSESVGGYENYLYAVEAVNDHDVWAVGSCEGCYGSGVNFRTLVEHYDGSCPTATPSPISTATSTSSPVPSATPTSSVTTITTTPTATLAATLPPTANWDASSTPISTPSAPASTSTASPATTATPISTPTACTLSFTDVPQGSTFYPYVHCLACLGIINGYPDGTFRPGEQVSRGQLAKIVSNSAGFQEPVGGQMFEDVVPGSTFYDFVWRLASRGYISGYPCSGVGEPCGPGNLPYFRPSNSATRGQISKIVSNAAGFGEPPGGQMFEDVIPGSSFYDYVQRLAGRGIITGYPCGGVGEPCGPASLPYFRPNADATRGQTAKIDANSFFPGCATSGD